MDLEKTEASMKKKKPRENYWTISRWSTCFERPGTLIIPMRRRSRRLLSEYLGCSTMPVWGIGRGGLSFPLQQCLCSVGCEERFESTQGRISDKEESVVNCSENDELR